MLPDVAARVEIGSIAAAVLSAPLARALFAYVTADVEVGDDEVAEYHTRNPMRFAVAAAEPVAGTPRRPHPRFCSKSGRLIAEHLLAAARRRAFRNWLDSRRAALVQLAPGYEHPGDPRQPDNIHRH